MDQQKESDDEKRSIVADMELTAYGTTVKLFSINKKLIKKF